MKNRVFLFLFAFLFVACNASDDGPFIKVDPGVEIGTDPKEHNPDSQNGNDNTETSSELLEDITAGFQQLMTIYGFQGAQVAITRNNRLVYLKSFGKADIDANVDVDQNSLFRIAGVSKPITLTAISKLVGEGTIELDDLVFGEGSLLGTKYGSLPYESDELAITLAHLIEHKGGFSDIPYDVMFDDVSLTHADLISKVLNERSLSRRPGTEYEYSNFGYSLLGRIIEEVTGKSYAAYVKEAILTPMGITSMQIGNNVKEEALEHEVTYYADYDSPYTMNVNRMDSHGGWIASAKDLALFAMKSDTENSVPDILEPGERLDYLETGNWNHNGALPGTLSVLQVSYPTSYVVLLNNSAPDFQQIIQAIRDFMREKTQNRAEWPNIDILDNQ
ncbi:serine hydrolase domain-containing protein [Maribacter algicola]|uniref:Serine hydrolase domain-containing protein n=1 Tax=Meishania litoralis TaxID=3434685 RepID=A0ACC7LFE9_9FLAO